MDLGPTQIEFGLVNPRLCADYGGLVLEFRLDCVVEFLLADRPLRGEGAITPHVAIAPAEHGFRLPSALDDRQRPQRERKIATPLG